MTLALTDGLPRSNSRAVGVAHFDGAERRLQLLSKGKRKLAGSGWHGASDTWLRMVEKGVSLGGRARHDGKQSRHRNN